MLFKSNVVNFDSYSINVIMKKKLKYLGWTILAILVVGQFIRPKQNSTAQVGPNDISHSYPIPVEVKSIMDRACMDCHSANTNYPVYNKVFPVSWFLYNHVYGGKKHLDFSEFSSYPPKKQAHKLEEVVEMIDKEEMPLSSYLILHPEAKLTNEEKALITAWATSLQQKIEG